MRGPRESPEGRRGADQEGAMNKPLTDDTVSRTLPAISLVYRDGQAAAFAITAHFAIAFLLFSRSCCPGACLTSAADLRGRTAPDGRRTHPRRVSMKPARAAESIWKRLRQPGRDRAAKVSRRKVIFEQLEERLLLSGN